MKDPYLYKVYVLSGTNINSFKFIELDGVENLSIQRSLSFSDQYVLGGAESSFLINSPQSVELTIEKNLIDNDLLIQFTGSNPSEKIFIYNGNQYFELTNCYLTNYSVSISVGQFPKVGVKFISYGKEIQQNSNLLLSKYGVVPAGKIEFAKMIPKLNSIKIEPEAFYNTLLSKNNIYGIDYSIDVQRTPYYSIGSSEPNEVCPTLPIKISFSIKSKANENYKDDDFPKIFGDKNDFNGLVEVGSQKFNFPIYNARLASYSANMASQNILDITREYLGDYGL